MILLMISIIINMLLLSLRRKTILIKLLIFVNTLDPDSLPGRSNCEQILIIIAGLIHVQNF